MSDRVGVMSQGILQQVATPQEIYNNPVNGFVASFVGENNVFVGTVKGKSGDIATFETAKGQFNARLGANVSVGDTTKLFVVLNSVRCRRQPQNRPIPSRSK
jgi:spermidine/putrescine transport system ATP-binding protein